MEMQRYDLRTDEPTNRLTWVGARDTCVSKNNEIKERKAQMLAESGLYGALWRRRSPGNNDNEHFGKKLPLTHIHTLYLAKNKTALHWLIC